MMHLCCLTKWGTNKVVGSNTHVKYCLTVPSSNRAAVPGQPHWYKLAGNISTLQVISMTRLPSKVRNTIDRSWHTDQLLQKQCGKKIIIGNLHERLIELTNCNSHIQKMKTSVSILTRATNKTLITFHLCDLTKTLRKSVRKTLFSNWEHVVVFCTCHLSDFWFFCI